MAALRLRHGSRLSNFLRRSFYQGTPEPFQPLKGRKPDFMSPEESMKAIKSGQKIFVHGGAATPIPLLQALAKHGKESELSDISLIHIHTEGPGICCTPEFEGVFRSNSLFTGKNLRNAINEGRADFTPIFLGEIPLLFRRNQIQLDVALIHLGIKTSPHHRRFLYGYRDSDMSNLVSPPDVHGFCSLGPSVDCTRAAIQNAKWIIGLCNPQLPRTFGDGHVHESHFDSMVYYDHPLPVKTKREPSAADQAIGKLIAENLVHNGATLQMGIGSIPDSVLASLGDHKDLGVHTEMFSDGVVDLVDEGVITNAFTKTHPGKIVSGFVVGSKKVYDFIDNNPFVVMCDISYTNNIAVIAQNPKVTAINSCIEVDLTGQVVADSIGTKIFSGVGGQIDFLRGAALCTDGLGKPILALNSQTKRGESKIVPFVKQGANVTTSAAHVHYLVTEFGIASLFGRNLRERAYQLIQIAHPDHREMLEKAAFERLQCMPSP